MMRFFERSFIIDSKKQMQQREQQRLWRLERRPQAKEGTEAKKGSSEEESSTAAKKTAAKKTAAKKNPVANNSRRQ
jgi:hypothetical protein